MSGLKGRCTGGSMDRASDSGSEGWGFESLPVYQIKEEIPNGYLLFYFALRAGLEEGGTAIGGVKNMPVAYFLAGGESIAGRPIP